MPIKSHPFGKVELTGDDAKRFLRHLEEDPPNPAAKATLARGRAMLEELRVSGRIKLTLRESRQVAELCENPPPRTAALQAAQARYLAQVERPTSSGCPDRDNTEPGSE